ncbi:hypothetical protein [Winogradskyella sp.]|uniref:hypothetical protein n=1 Tax=Winogradskyella sp. TaxID=1883156 RepID=UPI003BAAC603
MENDMIKRILKDDLESPENEDFNSEIIQKLHVTRRKQFKILFEEDAIMHWFLFTSVFALFFYLTHESKQNANVIMIGSIICAIPLFLIVFNKIYALKNHK